MLHCCMFTRKVISRVSEQITPVWFRSQESPLCGKQRDYASVREKTTECMIMRFRRTKHLRRKQGGEEGGSEKPLNRILMLFVASWKWILENYHPSRNNPFFDWMKNLFRLFSMQTARQMSLMSVSNWLKLNHKLFTRSVDFMRRRIFSLLIFLYGRAENHVRMTWIWSLEPVSLASAVQLSFSCIWFAWM